MMRARALKLEPNSSRRTQIRPNLIPPITTFVRLVILGLSRIPSPGAASGALNSMRIFGARRDQRGILRVAGRRTLNNDVAQERWGPPATFR